MKTLTLVGSLWLCSLLALSAQTAVSGGGYFPVEPHYKDQRTVYVVRIAEDGEVKLRCAVTAGNLLLSQYESLKEKRFGELLEVVKKQVPKGRTIVHLLTEEGKGFEKTLVISKLCLSHGVSEVVLASGTKVEEPKDLPAPLDLSKLEFFEDGSVKLKEEKK